MKITNETVKQVKADLRKGFHPVAALGNRGLTFASAIADFIKFCAANGNKKLSAKIQNVNWKKYAAMLD